MCPLSPITLFSGLLFLFAEGFGSFAPDQNFGDFGLWVLLQGEVDKSDSGLIGGNAEWIGCLLKRRGHLQEILWRQAGLISPRIGEWLTHLVFSA